LGVAFGGNDRVYVADGSNDSRVQYFTATGSFLGKWGVGNPWGIDVAPNNDVYVTGIQNSRITYFTSSGSYLGQWGSPGSGNGEFKKPSYSAVSPNGRQVYVTDSGNHRVQYFNRNVPVVTPTSLGRVKALFK
jgi:DNA-binding beta-propeller fold protein YncE